MRRIKSWAYATLCIAWFLIVCSPALAVWIGSLFAVRLDLRFSNLDPLFEVPGWTRNELTYFVPKWRPF